MRIIELYGAPGSTKSTTAAEQYAKYSRQGIRSALVVENSKSWCERGHKFDSLDQISFLGGQCGWELDKIRAGYDMIFTDCPWPLTAFYGGYHGEWFYGDQLYWTGKEWEIQVRNKYPSIKRERYFLELDTNKYTDLGRIHSAKECVKIQDALFKFMSKHEIEYKIWEGNLN